MARYGQANKDLVVARLLAPASTSVEEVSREIGVGVSTLERWRAEALAMPERGRTWTPAARLEAVIATAAMDESTRRGWCREQGVYPSELQRWRTAATEALAALIREHVERAHVPTPKALHVGRAYDQVRCESALVPGGRC